MTIDKLTDVVVALATGFAFSVVLLLLTAFVLGRVLHNDNTTAYNTSLYLAGWIGGLMTVAAYRLIRRQARV